MRGGEGVPRRAHLRHCLQCAPPPHICYVMLMCCGKASMVRDLQHCKSAAAARRGTVKDAGVRLMLSGVTCFPLQTGVLVLQAVTDANYPANTETAVQTPSAAEESTPAVDNGMSIAAPSTPEAAGRANCEPCAAHAAALNACAASLQLLCSEAALLGRMSASRAGGSLRHACDLPEINSDPILACQ